MKFTKFYLCTLLISCLIVTGCKHKKNDEDIIIPAAELYQSGLKLLAKNKYSKAAEQFEKIFYQHPGDDITPQAELMEAYALFLDTRYDEAVDVLDNFIKLHPMNVDISYAHYLKALSYYMEISNVRLDQSNTVFAKQSFEEVIRRYPGSKYAIDATLKMDLINDHLAGQEMEIGRFYLNKKNPIAAIRRFQEVVDKYDTTSHIEEALYRLVESFVLIGLVDEAQKFASVLVFNYPNSVWYKRSYNLIENKLQLDKAT